MNKIKSVAECNAGGLRRSGQENLLYVLFQHDSWFAAVGIVLVLRFKQAQPPASRWAKGNRGAGKSHEELYRPKRQRQEGRRRKLRGFRNYLQ